MSAPARTQLEEMGLSSTCAEVLRHLWDYLDDQITPEGAHRLRSHMAACPKCQKYQVYQSCFLETVARLRVELGAPETLRERLAASLKDQGCGCWQKVSRSFEG
jgi:anti-sigma factor (TIGR02949 family)